jgi:predicted O-methyltransferase YrrM
MKIITQEEAFQVRDTDVNIPLDKSKYNFQFTRNWFRQRNQVTWSTYLRPLLDPTKRLNVVQIGVFEFMDAAWLMQNVLLNRQSVLHAIDPWEATTKLNSAYMEGCYKRALHNASPWPHQVVFHRGYSQEILASFQDGKYDLVVIDGDHRAPGVLADANHALRILKPGGIMVFDDVRNRIPKADHVLEGIRQFLELHESEVQLLWQHRYADCYAKV